MALNNYEEIVTNFASPTLVLAGPGAGKPISWPIESSVFWTTVQTKLL